MAVYDRRHMDRMRQDAIRRSQEMYSRTAGAPSEIAEFAPEPHTEESHTDKKKNILEELIGGQLDSDKLLIAALLLLLMREGADKKLLIALGYILL